MSFASSSRFSIGLTGGIGSGKTTVADLFGERGAALIDTDAIAHALTVPGGVAMPAIASEFGPDFLTDSGALDRARMRALVFAEPAARHRLEAILHPLIRQATEDAAVRAQGPYSIFIVPLLVESGTWKQRADRILVVDCSEATQIARVMQRNGLAEEQVRAIMAAQATRAQRLAAADDVIVNDSRIDADRTDDADNADNADNAAESLLAGLVDSSVTASLAASIAPPIDPQTDHLANVAAGGGSDGTDDVNERAGAAGNARAALLARVDRLHATYLALAQTKRRGHL